jgi:stearoyl-CoA desaturase (delta-9 desaturase)
VLENSRWNPLNAPFLIGTLVLSLALVPYHLFHSQALGLELFVTFAMYTAIGLGVTAGYHRLFSHRTYQASWLLRLLLLCFGAASFQNSALRWSSDHRLHHRFVDTDRDPYTIKKGFWHAHWIWVMESKSHPLQGVADLEKDPLVAWQDRHYFLIGAVVACIPLGIGLLTHNLWGHFVMGVLFRIVLTHHTTFLINSAAHYFGSRPYTDTNTARDNALLAPLTFGEGYHNFHHMWPGDYRNGVRWYQFDSTKWLLLGLSWVGMARNLRRIPDAAIRRAKLAMEEKVLSARVAMASPSVSARLRERLTAAHGRLDQALASFQTSRETRTAEWKATMLERRAELRIAWSEWKAARFLVRHLA